MDVTTTNDRRMTTDIPRNSERPLPAYSYVPGLAPHPMSDPRGHSFGVKREACDALDESSYRGNATYLYAIDLFNYGFYWEAHEEWESLWHVAGRRGGTADFLKALIKLAAAGVKAREGRAAGVRQHAMRAVELLNSTKGSGQLFGLDLEALVAAASEVAERAEELGGDGRPDAERTLPVVLRIAGK